MMETLAKVERAVINNINHMFTIKVNHVDGGILLWSDLERDGHHQAIPTKDTLHENETNTLTSTLVPS